MNALLALLVCVFASALPAPAAQPNKLAEARYKTSQTKLRLQFLDMVLEPQFKLVSRACPKHNPKQAAKETRELIRMGRQRKQFVEQIHRELLDVRGEFDRLYPITDRRFEEQRAEFERWYDSMVSGLARKYPEKWQKTISDKSSVLPPEQQRLAKTLFNGR